MHVQRPHQFPDYKSLLCVSQMVIKHMCNVYVVAVVGFWTIFTQQPVQKSKILEKIVYSPLVDLNRISTFKRFTFASAFDSVDHDTLIDHLDQVLPVSSDVLCQPL